MSDTNNILKRKNEDAEVAPEDQLNKRVALDSGQLDANDKQLLDDKTAPSIATEPDEYKPEIIFDPVDTKPRQRDTPEPTNVAEVLDSVTHITRRPADQKEDDAGESSKPVSNHREKEDPSYVAFRMYCPVKEASTIVGKKGEKINHIRDKANVRINVSENLKGVPERIVAVRGSSENVAKAFGLITRTILDEPEDEPASASSHAYTLRLLIPHPMVGYVIGKQGSKFREIEENSAAKLKAAEQPLPFSTDRVLSITGVGDAIHIAVYYVAQVWLEHKEILKKHKIVYYNPANYQHSNMSTMSINGMNNINGMSNMNSMGSLSQMNNMMPNSNMIPLGGNMAQNHMGNNMGLPNSPSFAYQQPNKSYNFQTMFQPAVHPQQPRYNPATPLNVPAQAPYTDDQGNVIVGDVITNTPVSVGTSGDKFNEDIFVSNSNIGSVIGKGGNNIKHIRETSGCSYIKIEPDSGQSILLGGGRGLTSIRKLTLTGSLQSINTAIYLINQRINADKERNVN